MYPRRDGVPGPLQIQSVVDRVYDSIRQRILRRRAAARDAAPPGGAGARARRLADAPARGAPQAGCRGPRRAPPEPRRAGRRGVGRPTSARATRLVSCSSRVLRVSRRAGDRRPSCRGCGARSTRSERASRDAEAFAASREFHLALVPRSGNEPPDARWPSRSGCPPSASRSSSSQASLDPRARRGGRRRARADRSGSRAAGDQDLAELCTRHHIAMPRSPACGLGRHTGLASAPIVRSAGSLPQTC